MKQYIWMLSSRFSPALPLSFYANLFVNQQPRGATKRQTLSYDTFCFGKIFYFLFVSEIVYFWVIFIKGVLYFKYSGNARSPRNS